MALYRSCPSCQSGKVKCEACVCQACSGKGQVACGSCKAGRRDCSGCQATGKVRCGECRGQGRTARRFWFFKWSPTCESCDGSGSLQCKTCNGAKKVSCTTCNGTGTTSCKACAGEGVQAGCDRCGGSRQVMCSECGGVGQFETDWSKSLKRSSVEHLRFEYEKRQRQIQTLETKIARVSRELDDMYAEYERDRAANPNRYREAGSYPSGLDTFPRQIDGMEREVRSLEDEMSDIQRVLDSR